MLEITVPVTEPVRRNRQIPVGSSGQLGQSSQTITDDAARFAAGAAVLTDDHAPVDQLLGPRPRR